MIPFELFTGLQPADLEVTSPETRRYNCIAWAAGSSVRWWQPGRYWPIENPDYDFGLGGLVQAFESQGFACCENGSLEVGYEKIALYSQGGLWTHASRQLPDGRWTSKFGSGIDATHPSPDSVCGTLYGDIFQFMRRATQSPSGAS